jgi:thioredoxin 1
MSGKNIVILTDKNFAKEVIESPIPVLVDFTANWCGPCKALAPVLEKVADAHAGKVKVGKVDVDQNQATAQEYKVFSIPTLMLFKGGKVADQSVGLVAQDKIEKMIAKAK